VGDVIGDSIEIALYEAGKFQLILMACCHEVRSLLVGTSRPARGFAPCLSSEAWLERIT
jgi:hypothetical protein